LIILVTFIALIGGTTKISTDPQEREFIESVSTFVCPAKKDNASGAVQLGRTGVKSALVDKQNRVLRKSKERSLTMGSRARVLAGDSATPLVVASKNSTWLALSQCNSSAGEFWFLGGTADVSSLGYFEFTNENFGKAIIDVELWSEDGSEPTRTLSIPPRTTKNYSLTTFTPGKKLTAFHIVSRSGMVSATLFDERRKGLTTLGGDYVSPNGAPSKSVFMVGIPGSKFVKKAKISSQKLRLFVPGDLDSVIRVNYITPAGIFAPIGLDSLRVPAQKVVEVALSNLPKDQLFSLQVLASEPILASTLTRGIFEKRSEFIWSSSTEAVSKGSIALPERAAFLSMISKSQKATFTVIEKGGKKSKVTINIDSMAVWKVPASARAIQFDARNDAMYLSLTMRSPSGVSATTLAPAQVTEIAELPIVDFGLYIPDAR
jgi:hypothetical protein